MAHLHEDSDSYYLDQLCLVGFSAGFGGICLSLYTWQKSMLVLLLGPQFHPYVLASGIILVGLALIRGVILWKSVGQVPANGHSHNHEHVEHHHDHDHEHCQHDHDHDHSHDHEHSHAHDHGHSHDWAPWRYVILLVPIIFFLLGLPNKPPRLRAADTPVDISHEAAGYVTLVAGGTNPLSQTGLAAAIMAESSEKPISLPFKRLEDLSSREELRKAYAGKTVEVVGQFVPFQNNDRWFSLVRLRIQCCRTDAIQLNVPMYCKEPLRGLKPEQWIKVTGRVEFRRQGNSYTTVLQVPSLRGIRPDREPSTPYIQ